METLNFGNLVDLWESQDNHKNFTSTMVFVYTHLFFLFMGPRDWRNASLFH